MLKEARTEPSPSKPSQKAGEITSKFTIVWSVCWFPSLSGRLGKSFFFLIGFLFLSALTSIAQERDTTLNSKKNKTTSTNKHIDSLEQANSIKIKPKYHSPRNAALMSTIIPGSGQVYNEKYWKVPIIYAGLAGLAYSFNFNQTRYIKYRNAFKVRLTNGPGTFGNYPRYTDGSLDLLQQYYHRYRNLTVIGASLLYLLNIVDASVDAHMFTYDVSDDLSFNIRPALINTANINHYTTGLSLNIRF